MTSWARGGDELTTCQGRQEQCRCERDAERSGRQKLSACQDLGDAPCPHGQLCPHEQIARSTPVRVWWTDGRPRIQSRASPALLAAGWCHVPCAMFALLYICRPARFSHLRSLGLDSIGEEAGMLACWLAGVLACWRARWDLALVRGAVVRGYLPSAQHAGSTQSPRLRTRRCQCGTLSARQRSH